MWKKTFSLVLALALMLPIVPFNNPEVQAAAEPNLLQNPGFENGKADWNFVGAYGSNSGSGVQTNNPHSGNKGFFLDSTGEGNLGTYAVEQEVTVPYTGTYKTSAFISTGGSKSSFGVRKADGTVLNSVVIPDGASYDSAHTLSPIELKQGDQVIIYCKNGTGWTNGDDFTFEYDPSSVIHNLLNNNGFDQMVRIPKSGQYILSAMISGNGDVTITAGGVSQTFPVTDIPQEIKLTLPDLPRDTELDISATAGATITDYSFVFDINSIVNHAPKATNVSISGNYWSGQTLTGNYTFTDEDQEQTEGNSLYQWYSSDTPDGTYTAIDGETKTSLVLGDEDVGKYFKFAVTPVDMWGLNGEQVMSVATDDMVKINYVRNYSFDIEENGSPAGWKFANGGQSPYNPSEAKTGFSYGYLPANLPNAELYYTFTAEKTASYDLSMYINAAAPGTEIGVRYQGDSGAIKSLQTTTATSGYEKVTLTDIPIEKGAKVEVYAKSGSCTEVSLIDDVEMFVNEAAGVPDMANLFSFKADQQIGDAVMNSENKTITFKVPYGTDVTSLNVGMKVSEGATISPSTTGVDFTKPLQFTISKNAVRNVWTVTCEKMDKRIALKSSNKYLENAFNWAVNKTDQFVMTGKSGLINKSEYGLGTGPVQYIPSYWAGYYDRTAFYGRDFVHQATGGQIAGLAQENFNMFKTFAKGANESRKWYTLWAYNFDGSDYTLDYRNDNSFVREVPAQFELVQRAYEQYRWTGDERYVQDDTLFNFYTKVMTDFVDLHDTNGNGLAEGTGTGSIFAGSCTYNERGNEHPIEAGDSVGSQYQAMLAYSGILKARGNEAGAVEWSQKAANLKTYFNKEWSVKEGYNGYARGLAKDGTKYTGFGKENSWFMPMKLITEPGQRNDDYMAFIEQNLGTGIGSTPEAPTNIEAYTYIPDMYFPYNKADLAWKWMKYIIDVKDEPHERPSQGTNGDYPEISFTLTSQIIEGMMGIEPNAGEHQIITAPRLPSEVNDVEAMYIPVGEHEIDVKHTGLTQTQVTNISSKPLTWEARFYGDYNKITVGKQTYGTKHKDVNGVRVSYATITVPANDTLEAKASNSGGSDGTGSSGGTGSSDGSDGSSGSSGSSDSTPTTPETNKPAEKPKESITLKPSVDSNGNTRAIVSDNDVTDMVKNDHAKNVHVIIDVPTTTQSVEVELSKTAVNSLARSNKDLVINSRIGDVRLNKVTLTQLMGTGIVVKIKKAAEVDRKPAITVTILADGKLVTKFNGVVNVSIPYGKEASEIAENIVVYRTDGNNKVIIPSTKVIDGKVVIATQYSSTFVVAYNPKTFTDIANHWAKDSIASVTARELFTGVTTETFAPNESMTRGMLVTVLGKLDNANVAGKTANFSDISADKYYAPFIAWANENAIVSGIGNQHFAPDKEVTREELALIIANYAKYANVTLANTNTAAKFTDEETISSWALSAVNIIQGSGIISGKPGNKFDAKGKVTRAEAAKVINLLIYKIVQ
ncbi:S-layer homology domain-containing protein [Paenibacillus azoreducens]|uniref:S-layer homology domain-containing protein n=1 Tax=Paenibacillus azoreducens TaxID=116718 RepID=UPI0039F51697